MQPAISMNNYLRCRGLSRTKRGTFSGCLQKVDISELEPACVAQGNETNCVEYLPLRWDSWWDPGLDSSCLEHPKETMKDFLSSVYLMDSTWVSWMEILLAVHLVIS